MLGGKHTSLVVDINNGVLLPKGRLDLIIYERANKTQ